MENKSQELPVGTKIKNRKTLTWLSLAAIAMFGFGYALVPLYNVMCNALGLNGKVTMQATNTENSYIDQQRTVTVQFITSKNAELPWQFYPLVNKITLHPGENKRVAFFAENDSKKMMTVQAMPSIAPGEAAKYLRKTECFCFQQQTLKPGQSLDMPVIFHLDPELPKHVKLITLSYTLFDAEQFKSASPEKQGKLSAG